MFKRKYYAVWQGRRTGVFSSWKKCKPLVEGYPNGFKSFSTYEEADKRQKEEMAKIQDVRKRENLALHQGISIYVNWNPLFVEVDWRIVNTLTLELIHESRLFKDGTKDVAEFIAIVQALNYCKKRGLNFPIYSVNDTVINGIKGQVPIPTMPENGIFREAYNWAIKWLKDNTFENQLIEWDKDNWGINPADKWAK